MSMMTSSNVSVRRRSRGLRSGSDAYQMAQPVMAMMYVGGSAELLKMTTAISSEQSTRMRKRASDQASMRANGNRNSAPPAAWMALGFSPGPTYWAATRITDMFRITV